MAIITLQCGNYANYIGAHFWNLQESEFEYDTNRKTGILDTLETVDNDILYREGVTLDRQDTYTPRLVTIDLKGSLGTLPELGDLYHKPTVPKLNTLNWYGKGEVLKEEPPRLNPFLQELRGTEQEDSEKEEDEEEIISDTDKPKQDKPTLCNLDKDVHYWSDYLFARYHPKSVLVVDSFQHENTTHPFDIYGLGNQLWLDQHQDIGAEVEDRIRFFAEETDNLQGFHFIADSHSGFGGLAGRITDLLADDYGSKSTVNIPVLPPTLPAYTFHSCGSALASNTLTLARFLEHGLTTPLSLLSDWFPLQGRSKSFEYLNYDPQLEYHSSAILAAALDTASLVYRRKDKSANIGDVIAGLGEGQRNMAVMSTSLPFNLAGIESIESDLLSRLTPLIPSSNSTHSIRSYPALFTMRGILKSAIFKNRSSKYSGLSTADEYIEYCIREDSSGTCIPRICSYSKPLRTGKPFPHMFDPRVSVDGNILGKDRSKNDGVSCAPMLTSWNTGPSAGASIANLAGKCKKLNISRLPRLMECGTEEDDWREAVESIHNAAGKYNEDDDDMI
jgi:hypothetical protein